MPTITGKTKAWTTDSYFGPKEIQRMLDNGLENELVSRLSYYDFESPPTDWSEVGHATITVELHSTEVLVEKKVESLRQEVQETRANAQRKVQDLEDKINNLLALPSSITVQESQQ